MLRHISTFISRIAVSAIVFALGETLQAASCWYVSGWSSDHIIGAQALVRPTPCTTTPLRSAWTRVAGYGAGPQPRDVIWLRLPLNDKHISALTFRPLLFFTGYDTSGRPVIVTDLLPGGGDVNKVALSITPPLQGSLAAGVRVRLRHRDTGLCIWNLPANGVVARNARCADEARFIYVLDEIINGRWRIRNETTQQCLYTVTSATYQQPMYHWGCWNDPNMQFELRPLDGGFAIRHINTLRCALSDTVADGEVLTQPCGDVFLPLSHVYHIDIIGYPRAPCDACDRFQERTFRPVP